MLQLDVTQLPPHIYWFASVLLGLLGLFIVRFMLPAVALRQQLARTQGALKKAQPTGNADLAPLFDGDPRLAHLWKKYSDTLHLQKELNAHTGQYEETARRATVPSEMFFSTDSVVDARLGTEFFKHLPGIFTGIGILGTFYGLILGLQAFHVSENPSIVRQSLDALLRGVFEAFFVSAAAIALAMLVTFVERLVVTKLYARVEDLNKLLDGLFQSGAGEEYLARLVRASEESATHTAQLKDSLVSDLKQVLSEMTDRQIAALNSGHSALGQTIGHQLETSLRAPLEAIAQAAGEMRHDQGEAVTQLLTDVLAGFSDRMQELFGGQITGINSLQQQTIEALQVAVTRLEQMAANVEAGSTRAADNMADRLGQAMTAMEARQTALNQRMGEFLDHVRQQTAESQSETSRKLHEALELLGTHISDMVTSLERQSSQATAAFVEREQAATDRTATSFTRMEGQVDAIVTAIGAASTQMASAVTAIKDVTTDAISRMNSGADTLYIAASEFAKAGQEVKGTLSAADATANQLTQAAGSLSAATRSLDGSLADHKATRDAIGLMVRELHTIVAAAKKEAALTADVLHRLDAAAGKLATAQNEADVYLDKISDVLAEAHGTFASNMQKTLSEANAKFHERLGTATSMLAAAIEELEASLPDRAVRV